MVGWHELAIESRGAARQPARRPGHAAALRLDAAGVRRRHRPPFPSIYVLHGMTGQARAWFNVSPFAKNLPERVDEAGLDADRGARRRLHRRSAARSGIDSPAIGALRHVPLRGRRRVRRRALPHAARRRAPRPRREVVGRVRGDGLGACCRPDLFGGFATHAGDALFEVSLAPELAAAAQALRNLYDGSFERFWADFRSGRPVLANRTDPLLQNAYATAAAYSPTADGSVELPVPARHRRARPRGVGALARVGPGAARAAARRGPARRARDLDRRRAGTTSTTSTSERRRSARRCARPAWRTRTRPLRAVRGRPPRHILALSAQPGVPRRPARRGDAGLGSAGDRS